MSVISSMFATKVFDDQKQKQLLSKECYTKLSATINQGVTLDTSICDEIADVLKKWALDNGATHFTHWFLPLTGVSAEKHDAFMDAKDDSIVEKFTGKNLLYGEPDASSFPNGGLRSTAEARGYTIWDPTSYVFLKKVAGRVVLCIPCVFIGYHGESLDKKVPLLRSTNALTQQAKRVLSLFGKDVDTVAAFVGPEQEYFITDREKYLQREDLVMTGRTLFGALPPKNQELEEHYFGAVKERVQAFMNDFNEELWELGITAKTEHNEVAPAQHEVAPIFKVAMIASDQNMVTMEIMQRVAARHGLACLLHEKPFAGVNGSGKHNNWSICANGKSGFINMTDPGDTPHTNLVFLLTLACIVKAVDEHAVYLRLAASTPGNDFRLGANEAPPAIISMFLGSQLGGVVDEIIEKGYASESTHSFHRDLGIPQVAPIMVDATDRNRTSPFAFTGNKFEFRMVASSIGIADVNTALNTFTAQEFKRAADALEGSTDFEKDCLAYITKTLREHKRVIFNGNGYSNEWVEEASRRGLPNVKTFVEANESVMYDTTVKSFEEFGILNKAELEARMEINYELYSKVKNIEALTAISMLNKQYLPAIKSYAAQLSTEASLVKESNLDASAFTTTLASIVEKLTKATELTAQLEEKQAKAFAISDAKEQAYSYMEEVNKALEDVRTYIDALESLVCKDYWPVPNYGELVFEI